MAYEGQKKSVVLVTPICDSVYSKLRDPDDYGWFKEICAYDPKNSEEDAMFLGKLRKFYNEEAFPTDREPWWEECDRETKVPTGRYLVKFATKKLPKMTDRAEEGLAVPPMLAKGSRVKIKAGISWREATDKEGKPTGVGWVNLWLNEIQFVTIIEPSQVGSKPEPAVKKEEFNDDIIPF